MRTLHISMTSTKSWHGLLVLPPKNFIETPLTLAYVQTPPPPPPTSENNRRRGPFSDFFSGRRGYFDLKIVVVNRPVVSITLTPKISKLLLSEKITPSVTLANLLTFSSMWCIISNKRTMKSQTDFHLFRSWLHNIPGHIYSGMFYLQSCCIGPHSGMVYQRTDSLN